MWHGLFMQLCTKIVFWIQVIGKALVLDEIINYIQSLQRQVEVGNFLLLIRLYLLIGYFLLLILNLSQKFHWKIAVFVHEAWSSQFESEPWYWGVSSKRCKSKCYESLLDAILVDILLVLHFCFSLTRMVHIMLELIPQTSSRVYHPAHLMDGLLWES